MEPIETWPGEWYDLSTGRSVFVRRASAPRTADGPAGERIVHVHGLGGAATNWTALMRELRADADQWAPDLPGFGESPPAPRHTVDGYVADVVAFLERFGSPSHVVANSLGGMVSVYVAARRPDLVRTLSLVSPAMPQYRLPWAAQVTAVMAVPGLGERILAAAGANPSERQIAQLAAVLFADPAALPAAEFDLAVRERTRWMHQPYADAVLLGTLRSIVAQYTMPPRRSAWGAAARVLCPTLVMMGGRDTLVGSWGRARWRRTRPRTRLVTLPSSGHVAMMEHPRAVADLIREFLRDTSGRR
ncbi:alpha/beta fold hydrolase [Haloactinopolyspora alba]|uniref:alpha/beta fold hydrolase n=1 Tax=Haloactinopolyspora alba TaxID=648780 RepID=UPI0013EC20EE|nr:alpha/beta fold hydrolase [Haloactinopolyspora alba]